MSGIEFSHNFDMDKDKITKNINKDITDKNNTENLEKDDNLEKKWKKINYEKKNKKIASIKEKAEKVHELDQLEAELILKLSLDKNDKIINIIENKKEFEFIHKEMWALLMIGGNDINEKEVKEIKKKWPKNFRDHLVLSYDKNPQKFKDLFNILDWVNRNWLQNFFNKDTIKFEDRIKRIKENLEKEFVNTEHIPDSEKKFLDNIKKYYK